MKENYTLIDFTKSFHSLCKTRKLSAGARSAYTAIVGEANEAHFPERIYISDRELGELAGIKSVASIHEVKNVLKNHGLIEFSSKRGKCGRTEYQLLTDWIPNIQNVNRTFSVSTEHSDAVPNINRTLAEHSANISRTLTEHSAGVPIVRAREDVKTEDVKTKAKGNARTREGECEGALDVWADEMPRPLTASEKGEVSAFVEQYGFERVKAAIIATRRKRFYPTFDDFKKELTDEGGGQDEPYRYNVPVYRGDEPWFAPKYAD